MTKEEEYASQGFDLDAAAAASDGDDVVYEIGGGATITPSQVVDQSPKNKDGDKEDKNDKENDESKKESNNDNKTREEMLLEKAEHWKEQGNVQFKAGNYLEAIDMYTEAIEACPCPVKGPAILELQKQHDKAEQEASLRRFRQAEIDRDNERKTQREKEKQKKTDGSTSSTTTASEKDETEQQKATKSSPDDNKPKPFVLPTQFNGDKLSIFYNNRAAAYYQLQHYKESIEDCNVAILLNPTYTKAYVRRSMAYEKYPTTSNSSSFNDSGDDKEQTHIEQALSDMKLAQSLEPKNATINKNVKRLQKLEDERLEKLKTETMGTLYLCVCLCVVC